MVILLGGILYAENIMILFYSKSYIKRMILHARIMIFFKKIITFDLQN